MQSVVNHNRNILENKFQFYTTEVQSLLLVMHLPNSVSACSLFTSDFNNFSPSPSWWWLSSSVFSWMGVESGISSPWLNVPRSCAVASLVSSSLSDSPDVLNSSGRQLFFLCFFLLFFFLLFLWCRCALLPLGVSSCRVRFLRLLSRLFVLLFPSLLELLDFSFTFLGVSVLPSLLSLPLLILLYLFFSRLLLLNLSDVWSLRLLLRLRLLLLLRLRHRPVPLSLRPDLTLHRQSASLLLKDLSDLSGLLLRRRRRHERSRCSSERPSLRLPLLLRSGDKCRSLSASQNSLVGFRKTCRKLQCFPLGHFWRSNNPTRQ